MHRGGCTVDIRQDDTISPDIWMLRCAIRTNTYRNDYRYKRTDCIGRKGLLYSTRTVLVLYCNSDERDIGAVHPFYIRHPKGKTRIVYSASKGFRGLSGEKKIFRTVRAYGTPGRIPKCTSRTIQFIRNTRIRIPCFLYTSVLRTTLFLREKENSFYLSRIRVREKLVEI